MQSYYERMVPEASKDEALARGYYAGRRDEQRGEPDGWGDAIEFGLWYVAKVATGNHPSLHRGFEEFEKERLAKAAKTVGSVA